MKTSTDPRHLKRQHALQDLFKVDFHTQRTGQIAKDVIEYKERIDGIIQKAAPEYPIDKINKVDLAILRLAVYELVIKPEAPQNVIFDEAIELAKEFGSETSPSFINGALGAVIKNEKHITDIQK